MAERQPKIIEILSARNDTIRVTLSSYEWELFIRQSRASGLLSRIAIVYKNETFIEVPDYVEKHFDSAAKFWLSQKRIIDWELYLLKKIFDQAQIPVILLKGAAYIATGLKAGYGRICNDIDILVPEDRLPEIRELLKLNGWFDIKLSAYDQRYYNLWMHELPPLRHIKRGTTLDVHHNILPKTCALYPDANLFWLNASNLTESSFRVLSPQDMLIHSACHLFWGEIENGIRDLNDMDLLIQEFSTNRANFFDELIARAYQIGLTQPLYYALRYAKILMHSPIPEGMISRLSPVGITGFCKMKVMDFLFLRALMPDHPSCSDRWTGLARWLLYIRSHWLRMPMHLLIPHLLRKSWMRMAGKEKR
ncbi:MAG: nucleotidyltransferase family protein [Methylomicrobium sp.]